ncbi:MAG: type II toxin-antitoxin system PemK/MazF family toxin [Verrucomicrobia bacterium]|nr:type II toxin-antitoxin system PemK/MazF family toxin [Verrucomicrobiota bacterium]
MNAWEIHTADLGWGDHPVVIVSHPARAARKPVVEVLSCSSRRAARPAEAHEVILDEADGLDWPTLCRCDCIHAVERTDIKGRRGAVSAERRRQIVRAIVQSHGWNLV